MLTDAFAGLQKLVLPDRWQAAAIRALESGRDVVIDAPTGAGKTYVFERWAEQTNFARRALFTVPTRALANDKYAEWRARGWRVGIITGDITIDPGAPLIVATLEAVQSQINAPTPQKLPDRVCHVLRDKPPASPNEFPPINCHVLRHNIPARPTDLAPFQLLVVDEYHWLADTSRGNHYEGALLSAPPNLQLLLLSGAVANPTDVAAWLRRLGRNVEVVAHTERPVPLEEVEVDDLIAGLPRTIEGFWSRRIAGALREGLGPVLIFAPHRTVTTPSVSPASSPANSPSPIRSPSRPSKSNSPAPPSPNSSATASPITTAASPTPNAPASSSPSPKPASSAPSSPPSASAPALTFPFVPSSSPHHISTSAPSNTKSRPTISSKWSAAPAAADSMNSASSSSAVPLHASAALHPFA